MTTLKIGQFRELNSALARLHTLSAILAVVPIEETQSYIILGNCPTGIPELLVATFGFIRLDSVMGYPVLRATENVTGVVSKLMRCLALQRRFAVTSL